MLWLGAHYVAREKLRKGSGEGALPLGELSAATCVTGLFSTLCDYVFLSDPVARFHLRNGAAFHSINWLGNSSTPGLQSSAGLMANYMYDGDLGVVERRAAAFEQQPESLLTGPTVQAILAATAATPPLAK